MSKFVKIKSIGSDTKILEDGSVLTGFYYGAAKSELFFQNGAVYNLDEAGESLPYLESMMHYGYLENIDRPVKNDEPIKETKPYKSYKDK
jgi:hypothetical protein